MWTDEKVCTITRMWGEGHSSATIGREIGKSRNAVIGKLGRMGLIGDADANRQLAKTRTAACKRRQESLARPRAPVPPRPIPKAKSEPTDGIPLEALTKTTCRWPLLDNPPQLYCGKHTETGQYCPEHSKRAFSAGKGVKT